MNALPVAIRALLELVTPPTELPYLLDDLSEEFDARARTTTHPRATLWLYSQAIRSLGPLAMTRLRARRAGPAELVPHDGEGHRAHVDHLAAH